ncbi:GDSL-type esterase/lipase family protein [Amycolatopsis sp. M39]
MVTGTTTTASASPDDLQGLRLATWNLQGGSAGIDSKWTAGVLPLLAGTRGYLPHDFVFVQEAGPQRGTHATEVASSGNYRVIQTLFRLTPSDQYAYIYWMEVDFNGHRVNTAIVTRRAVDNAFIVPGERGNPASRPVFGLRIGSTVLYSVHSLSRTNGADAPALLENMNAAAGASLDWLALGDFNQDPTNLQQAMDNRGGSGGPVGHIVNTGQATHQNGGELDYGVTSLGLSGFLDAERLDNPAGSDHNPVEFTTLPQLPDYAEDDQYRVMGLGDSITAGIGDSNGTGYRDDFFNEMHEAPSHADVDMVGSQKRGVMDDPDNEGHPGWRIDEIMSIADCTVGQYQPNVVTLMAGTNDINQNYELETAPQRLKELIEHVQKDSPKAVVVVAKLTPTGKAGLQPRIDKFNGELPRIVSELQNDGKHVVLVDTKDINVAEGLQGDAHPDDGGYSKLGSDFYRGVVEAAKKHWIQAADPQNPGGTCRNPDDSAAGPGWRALGVVAPGMGSPAGRTELADVDGDGRDDYIRIPEKGTLRIAVNRKAEPGKPHWVEVQTDVETAGHADAEGLRLADLDGNGRADFVHTWRAPDAKGGTHNVEFNSGPNGEQKLITRPVDVATGKLFDDTPPEAIRFADVDGNGYDDYLRVGENGSIHAYFTLPTKDNVPTWDPHLSWAPGVFYGSREKLRMADVDGDGKADYLMVGNKGAVHAYLNKGGRGIGGFEEHRYFVKETGYPGVKSAFRDISGDGKADYIVLYKGGSVRCWLNEGGNL